MMNRFFLFLTLAFGSAYAEPTKPLIAVSNYPLQWVTETLVGDQAEVINLTQDAENPREWVPDDKSLQTLERADLILLQGGGYEIWAQDQNLPKAFDTSEAISKAYFAQRKLGAEQQALFYIQTQGRAWLDPLHLALQAQAIANALEKNLLQTEPIQQNLAQVQKDLQALTDLYRSHPRLNRERILTLEPTLALTLGQASGWKIKPIAADTSLDLEELQKHLPETYEYFPARMAVSVHAQPRAVTDYLQRFRIHLYAFNTGETAPSDERAYPRIMIRNFKTLTSGYLTP